jgi:hypothetical protein
MIEALACGTPVIAWRKGSVPAIIETAGPGSSWRASGRQQHMSVESRSFVVQSADARLRSALTHAAWRLTTYRSIGARMNSRADTPMCPPPWDHSHEALLARPSRGCLRAAWPAQQGVERRSVSESRRFESHRRPNTCPQTPCLMNEAVGGTALILAVRSASGSTAARAERE